MKALLDTNVVLDVLLIREPFAQMAMNLFDAVVEKKIEAYLCATTVTTIDYLVAKQKNKQESRALICRLLDLFSVAEVNQTVLNKASLSDFTDFEDAVLYQAGCYIGVDCLITRNVKDFKEAKLPIYTHAEFQQIMLLGS